VNTGDVDGFLADGCGRCGRNRTPDSEARRGRKAPRTLRSVALEAGMDGGRSDER
jgi:hypothetical protein